MYITRELIRMQPNTLFVFGDNDRRTGLSGMAKEFRGEPNSIGIRTKKAPSGITTAFYCDSEFEDNCRKIDEDIETILKQRQFFKYIFIPEGIGRGLARLQDAPRTLAYLEDKIEFLRESWRE